MAKRGIPKKNARLFRIVQRCLCSPVWRRSSIVIRNIQRPGCCLVFAVAAVFALLDAIIGWRSSRE